MTGPAAWKTYLAVAALLAAGAAAARFSGRAGGLGAGGSQVASESITSIPADPPLLGGIGLGDGEFFLPRGITCDSEGNVYVVDRKARIQKFDVSGKFVKGWRMPEFGYGNPKGLCCDLDGNLVVADTHYNRIARFSPNGCFLGSFGRFGMGPGMFVWPLAAAVDPATGDIYVCDYGSDADRVQKFDRSGRFIWSVGKTGTEVGEFRRPSGLTVDRTGTVYVADAVNHRIVRLDPDGNILKMWGGLGDAPGRLAYPYDISCSPEGILYVAEFGNNRVQAFDAEGKSLGIYGGSPGGPIASPWGICAAWPGRIYVGDTGHSRVVILKPEWILGRFQQPGGRDGGSYVWSDGG